MTYDIIITLPHIILICNAFSLVGSKCEIFRPRSFNTGYIATELMSFSFLKAILQQYAKTILWLTVLPYHHLDFAKSYSTTLMGRILSFVRKHVTCVTNVRNTINFLTLKLMIVFYVWSVIIIHRLFHLKIGFNSYFDNYFEFLILKISY